jgi:hypothetical protein
LRTSCSGESKVTVANIGASRSASAKRTMASGAATVAFLGVAGPELGAPLASSDGGGRDWLTGAARTSPAIAASTRRSSTEARR